MEGIDATARTPYHGVDNDSGPSDGDHDDDDNYDDAGHDEHDGVDAAVIFLMVR